MATRVLLDARIEFRKRKLAVAAANGLMVIGGISIVLGGDPERVFFGVVIALLGPSALVRLENSNPIQFVCPDCDYVNRSNWTWNCEFCGCEVRPDTDWKRYIMPWSWLDLCPHCYQEQLHMRCHRCGHLHFFTPQAQATYERRIFNIDPSKRPPSLTQADFYRSERERLEHEIEMTKLRHALNQLKSVPAPAPPAPRLSPQEQMEKRIKDGIATGIAAHEMARKAKAENAQRYKDDPDMLKRANAAVDAAVREAGI